MSVAAAQLLVMAIALYLASGAVFALAFLWRWVGRLDPLAAAGTLGFRVLVFPGVTVFWPLFATRLVRHVPGPPEEWTAHRTAARRRAGRIERPR
jgi:hypothetical protein